MFGFRIPSETLPDLGIDGFDCLILFFLMGLVVLLPTSPWDLGSDSGEVINVLLLFDFNIISLSYFIVTLFPIYNWIIFSN